jgi:hypothetical protein
MSDFIITIFLMVIFPIGVMVLVLYLITKKSHPDSGGPKHSIYYLMSFVTLLVLYWAVCDLIRIIFNNGLLSVTNSFSDLFFHQVEWRLASILVALPLWAFHFMKAFPPKNFPVDLGSRKVYALAVTLCSVFIIIPGWIIILYSLMLIGMRESLWVDLILSISSYITIATLLWLVHFKMWKKLNEKTNSNITQIL